MSVREVVDGAKKHRRDAEGDADQHRFPCALFGKQEDGEYREQQHCKNSAEDDRSTTVVMRGRLRISMK